MITIIKMIFNAIKFLFGMVKNAYYWLRTEIFRTVVCTKEFSAHPWRALAQWHLVIVFVVSILNGIRCYNIYQNDISQARMYETWFRKDLAVLYYDQTFWIVYGLFFAVLLIILAVSIKIGEIKLFLSKSFFPYIREQHIWHALQCLVVMPLIVVPAVLYLVTYFYMFLTCVILLLMLLLVLGMFISLYRISNSPEAKQSREEIAKDIERDRIAQEREERERRKKQEQHEKDITTTVNVDCCIVDGNFGTFIYYDGDLATHDVFSAICSLDDFRSGKQKIYSNKLNRYLQESDLTWKKH